MLLSKEDKNLEVDVCLVSLDENENEVQDIHPLSLPDVVANMDEVKTLTFFVNP